MQTPSPVSQRSGNPDRGNGPAREGAAAEPPGEPSPALPPAPQTGRDNPRAGDTAGTPLSVGTPCRGRQRGGGIPRGAHGAAPAARNGGSAALSAPRAPGELWAASREPKAEAGAAAGPTDSAQAAPSALPMGESSAKHTPGKGIKEARSYRIFIKSGVVYRAVWGGGRHPRHC